MISLWRGIRHKNMLDKRPRRFKIIKSYNFVHVQIFFFCLLPKDTLNATTMTSHMVFILKSPKICKQKVKRRDSSKETFENTLKTQGLAKLEMNDMYETARR